MSQFAIIGVRCFLSSICAVHLLLINEVPLLVGSRVFLKAVIIDIFCSSKCVCSSKVSPFFFMQLSVN